MLNLKLPEHVSNPDPSVYLSTNYVVLDFENTIVDEDGSPLNPDVSLLMAYTETRELNMLRWEGDVFSKTMAELCDYLSGFDFIVAHHAKHELQWLARCGMDLAKLVVFDTQVAEYVLGGNLVRPLGLGEVSSRYGFKSKDKYVDLCMKAHICPSTYPRSLLRERCRLDVETTHRIFSEQLKLLSDRNQLPVMYTRCLLSPVLADIERNGMHLDNDAVASELAHYQRVREATHRGLLSICGDININSPEQLGDFVYGELGFSELTDKRGTPIRTPKGRRKTDKETLARLTPTSGRQKKFTSLWSAYNQADSYLSKNLEFFDGVCCENSGSVFRATFNQTVTRTHRLSSSGRATKFKKYESSKSVQLQNLPRIFKKLFSARKEGWSIGEADGAQLEFRMAVQMGKDSQGLTDILSGSDRHKYTAAVLGGIKEEDVTSEQRQAAKAETFKPLYGGEYGTPKQMQYYAAFKRRYAGITGWQDANKYAVATTKQLRIPSGLIFYWPHCRIDSRGGVTDGTSICNYPVQSFATADVIPIVLVYMWHSMRALAMESMIVNTVHDSVIAEVHPDERDLYSAICRSCFTERVYKYVEDVYNYKFFVPLAAGIKFGTNWGVGPEEVYQHNPPYKLEECL